MKNRNNCHILGAAPSMFSAIKRIPAAVKGLLLVPRGGDGCAPLREGCTKTSSDVGIQLDSSG